MISKLGLEDWIASDRDAYITLAAAKARELDALADVRAGLRNRIADRGLTDGAGFVKRLESAYQEAWDQ